MILRIPAISQALLLGSGLILAAHQAVGGDNTWTPTGGLDGGIIFSIATAPNAPGVIYAGTDSGVFRSTDRGESWLPASNGLPTRIIDGIAVASDQSEQVYVATRGSGVFYSRDGGDNWTSSNDDFTDLTIRYVATDENAPDLVFAGTRYEIFRSIDRGSHWNSIGPNLIADNFVTAFATDPLDADVFVATVDGIYRSPDNGTTWLPPVFDIGVSDIVVSKHVTDLVYAVSGGNVIRSSDGGVNWSDGNLSLVDTLAEDPSLPGMLVAVSFYNGVYLSSDDTTTWIRKSDPANITSFISEYAVAFDEANGAIYAGTLGAGVYRSDDDAETWISKSSGLTAVHISDLVLDPENPAVVYASTYRSGILKSLDGGRAWSRMDGIGVAGFGEVESILMRDPISRAMVDFQGRTYTSQMYSMQTGTRTESMAVCTPGCVPIIVKKAVAIPYLMIYSGDELESWGYVEESARTASSYRCPQH